MYTELIFGAAIDTTRLTDVDLKALEYLFKPEIDWDDVPQELPDHPFFKCDRWGAITRCSSCYFAVIQNPSIYHIDSIPKRLELSSRANLKNYDNEIEKFLDWIHPHIEQGSGDRDFYAIVCYEEQDKPTIYYLKNKNGNTANFPCIE